jgi:protein-S-isoprenylcysteine O-methyltransferase Ste14
MNPANPASVTPVQRRYLLFGRVLPLIVFGILLAVQAQLLFDGLRTLPIPLTGRAVLGVLNRLFTVVFLGMVLTIYILRAPAVRTNRAPGAVLIAMVGSFYLFSVRLLPGGATPTVPSLLLGDFLLITGLVLSLYSLATLRRNFSLVPETRELVTKGPYRWVRHPLYVGETMSGLGLIVPSLSILNVTIFAIYLGAQLIRANLEDTMLRADFPQYAAWEQRTKRFVPWVY